MPRGKGRGGPRQGVQGKKYPNRTDMQLGPRQSPLKQAGPSPVYGEGVKREASLRAAPMGVPQPAGAPPPTGAPTGAGAPPVPPPGGIGDLLRPTERPDEPVTAGAPIGAGPGPEVLGPMFQDPGQQSLGELAPYLPYFEQLANLPTATIETRNFVRRLRGSVPPDARLDR